MLELREQGSGRSLRSANTQTPDLSAFQATLQFVQSAVDQDFGEPVYPLPPTGEQDELHSATEREEIVMERLDAGPSSCSA